MGVHVSRLEDVVVNEWLGRFLVVTGPMRSDKTRETRQFVRRIETYTPHKAMSFITVRDTRTVQDEDRARGWTYLSSEDDGAGSRPVQSQLFDNPEEILGKLALRDVPHLDAIIAFLSERGIRELDGVLVPKLYFRGERAGLYVNWEDGLADS